MPNMKVCPRCEAKHLDGDKFCKNCLMDLSVNDAQDTNASWLWRKMESK